LLNFYGPLVFAGGDSAGHPGPGGGGGWGGHGGGGPPGGWGGGGPGGWGGGPPGWGGGPPGPPGPPGGGNGPGGWGNQPMGPPACWKQCFQDAGLGGMKDVKDLCSEATKGNFLADLHRRACDLCKNDGAGLDWATRSLPNLEQKCKMLGLPLPPEICQAAQQAAKCGSSVTPMSLTVTQTTWKSLPVPTVISTVLATSTTYTTGAPAPPQPPPPPPGGSFNFTSTTRAFTQGLPTTSRFPTSTSPIAFTGAGSAHEFRWSMEVFWIAVGTLWSLW